MTLLINALAVVGGLCIVSAALVLVLAFLPLPASKPSKHCGCDACEEAREGGC